MVPIAQPGRGASLVDLLEWDAEALSEFSGGLVVAPAGVAGRVGAGRFSFDAVSWAEAALDNRAGGSRTWSANWAAGLTSAPLVAAGP